MESAKPADKPVQRALLCSGLVASANVAGEAESNNSQFFITLDRCDHLDRQNTIFGRVSGDTIYTVARMAEAEVDDDDKPIDPPKVVSTDVLWPPFDDIVPRTTPAQRAEEAKERKAQQKAAEIQKRKQTGAAELVTAWLLLGFEQRCPFRRTGHARPQRTGESQNEHAGQPQHTEATGQLRPQRVGAPAQARS